MNRKYDLDYLQWLQKNARLYMIGLGVVAFLMAVSIWLYYNPWQPQNSVALWQQRDSDQAVAEQQIPAEHGAEGSQNNVASNDAQTNTAQNGKAATDDANTPMQQSTTKQTNEQSAQATQNSAQRTDAADNAQHGITMQSNQQNATLPMSNADDSVENQSEAQQNITENTAQFPVSLSALLQTAEPQSTTQKNAQADTQPDKPEATVDLFQLQKKLPDFTAPCSGALAYGYGLGYDPICEDYRFHDAVCYKADGAEAVAVSGGTVQNVNMDSRWQLTLRCGDYTVQYGGLQSCNLAVGDTVTAGQSVGKAGAYLYVRVITATDD